MRKILVIVIVSVVLCLVGVFILHPEHNNKENVLNIISKEYNLNDFNYSIESDSTIIVYISINHYVMFYIKNNKIQTSLNTYKSESYKEAKKYFDKLIHYNKHGFIDFDEETNDTLYGIDDGYILHCVRKSLDKDIYGNDLYYVTVQDDLDGNNKYINDILGKK